MRRIRFRPRRRSACSRCSKRVGAQASRIEGSGLGLYIVKLIFDRMGAALEVKSEPGLGSCFSVGPADQAAAHGGQPSGRRVTAAIVSALNQKK
jgi:light-regulated signal transduction histidine kinase (bacteriophytochrome)